MPLPTIDLSDESEVDSEADFYQVDQVRYTEEINDAQRDNNKSQYLAGATQIEESEYGMGIEVLYGYDIHPIRHEIKVEINTKAHSFFQKLKHPVEDECPNSITPKFF